MQYHKINKDDFPESSKGFLPDAIAKHTGEPGLIIYPDGACSGNPGPGSFGTVILTGKGHVSGIYAKAEGMTTNNAMELSAIIAPLKIICEEEPLDGLGELNLADLEKVIHFRTDSNYAVQGLSSWLPGWKKNGWRTADKKPIKNPELWKELDRLIQKAKTLGYSLAIQHVNGHAGVAGNEAADKLANFAMNK